MIILNEYLSLIPKTNKFLNHRLSYLNYSKTTKKLLIKNLNLFFHFK